MKHIIFFLTLIPIALSAEILQLDPFLEDSPPMQNLRLLVIKEAADDIQECCWHMAPHVRERVYWNLIQIDYALGYPIDSEEVEAYLYD